MVAAADKDHVPLVKRSPLTKRFIDIAGRKFGKLTVRELSGFKGKISVWLCDCACGGTIDAWGNLLRTGRTQHCGCLSIYDGHSQHPLFNTWNGMIDRCHNESSKSYRLYGARGIEVCARWRNSFDDFAADVGDKPSPRHSLGRIDNDGNYEPGNVRWETRWEQQRNKRSCRYVTVSGETKTVSEWARSIGVTSEAMRLRLKKSASLEAIVSTPKGEIVVARPGNVAIRDDAPLLWPEEIPLNVVHHALAESHQDGLRIVETLRRVADAWGYDFRSRVLDCHVLFRVDAPLEATP